MKNSTVTCLINILPLYEALRDVVLRVLRFERCVTQSTMITLCLSFKKILLSRHERTEVRTEAMQQVGQLATNVSCNHKSFRIYLTLEVT